MDVRVNKEIIKSLKPCADRYENYLKYYNDFDGQLEEFLDLENITYQDKIWVAVRLMPRFLAEVFAIDCAVRSAAADCAAVAVAAVADCAVAVATAAAADCAVAANYTAERQNQIESIIYLIQNHEVLNER